MILWEDDLPGPLPIKQVSFRSNYLPSYEVHLSQTAGVDGTFFEPWKCSDQMHWFILQGWVRVPVGDQLVSRQKTFYWKQKYVMERFRTTTRTSCNEKMGGDLQRDRHELWWKNWSPMLPAQWHSSVLVTIPWLSLFMTSAYYDQPYSRGIFWRLGDEQLDVLDAWHVCSAASTFAVYVWHAHV